LLFVVFAYFCVFLFPRTERVDSAFGFSKKAAIEKQIARNRIFYVCGAIMIIAMMTMIGFVIYKQISGYHEHNIVILLGETVGLCAFGLSWLIKGEFMGLLLNKEHRDALSAHGQQNIGGAAKER
jgi:hypothetical protein